MMRLMRLAMYHMGVVQSPAGATREELGRRVQDLRMSSTMAINIKRQSAETDKTRQDIPLSIIRTRSLRPGGGNLRDGRVLVLVHRPEGAGTTIANRTTPLLRHVSDRRRQPPLVAGANTDPSPIHLKEMAGKCLNKSSRASLI